MREQKNGEGDVEKIAKRVMEKAEMGCRNLGTHEFL